MAIDPKIIDIYNNIATALRAAGAEVEQGTPYNESRITKVNGYGTEWGGINASERYSGGTWHSERTGQYQITIGDYGHKKLFPPRKNGFDYSAVAAYIIEWVDGQKRQQAEDKRRQSNYDAMSEEAARLNAGAKDCPLAPHFGVAPHGPGKLCLKVDLTPDQAAKVLAFLVSAF